MLTGGRSRNTAADEILLTSAARQPIAHASVPAVSCGQLRLFDFLHEFGTKRSTSVVPMSTLRWSPGHAMHEPPICVPGDERHAASWIEPHRWENSRCIRTEMDRGAATRPRNQTTAGHHDSRRQQARKPLPHSGRELSRESL